ncbi:beta-lactamase superfamily domain-containing protein [Mycena leptocephala]|nr:beta-lactamase superfamily domain-containing protein [Mycena leptocephala]
MAVLTPSKNRRNADGPFENPWPPVLTMLASALGLMRLPFVRATPLQQDLHGVKTVKTVKPNFEVLDSVDKLCATWLGHAGFLVQLPAESGQRPIRIVFDPIFSDRAYPSAWVGPRRRLPPPCKIQDLPDVDFVAISHNHYDHCDLDALKALWKKSHGVDFLVPLGVKATLESVGIPGNCIHDLDWWDNIAFPPVAGQKFSYSFTCTPAQHNSGRGMLDQNWSLWCSWVVQQIPEGAPPAASVYFAGDTGYQTAEGACPAFKARPIRPRNDTIWSGASLTVLGKMGYKVSTPCLREKAALTSAALRRHAPGHAARDTRGRGAPGRRCARAPHACDAFRDLCGQRRRSARASCAARAGAGWDCGLAKRGRFWRY